MRIKREEWDILCTMQIAQDYFTQGQAASGPPFIPANETTILFSLAIPLAGWYVKDVLCVSKAV